MVSAGNDEHCGFSANNTPILLVALATVRSRVVLSGEKLFGSSVPNLHRLFVVLFSTEN